MKNIRFAFDFRFVGFGQLVRTYYRYAVNRRHKERSRADAGRLPPPS